MLYDYRMSIPSLYKWYIENAGERICYSALYDGRVQTNGNYIVSTPPYIM